MKLRTFGTEKKTRFRIIFVSIKACLSPNHFFIKILNYQLPFNMNLILNLDSFRMKLNAVKWFLNVFDRFYFA